MPSVIPVEIVSYDPRWTALFEEAKREIIAAIGPYVSRVEHVGSTSVAGLAAKPTIDVLIGVHHLAEAPSFLPPLEALGYEYVAKHEAVFPQRRYLRRIVDGRHTHHLHIVEPKSNFFKEHLLFRDYLRSHPEDAARYAALKYELAEKYRGDRDAYTEGKSDFIQGILMKALRAPGTRTSEEF